MVISYPTFEVEVAKPEMDRPRRVVVPKPPPAISKAEMVEVPTDVLDDVEM